MYKYLKYIIVETSTDPDVISIPVTILFHYLLPHDSFCHSFRLDKVISAGFCSITPYGEILVFGKSNSLHKESRPEIDPVIIRQTINGEFSYPKGSVNIFEEKV